MGVVLKVLEEGALHFLKRTGNLHHGHLGIEQLYICKPQTPNPIPLYIPYMPPKPKTLTTSNMVCFACCGMLEIHAMRFSVGLGSICLMLAVESVVVKAGGSN